MALETDYPRSGWVQQDPKAILDTVNQVLEGVSKALEAAGGNVKAQVKAVGVTNQVRTLSMTHA